MAKKSAGTAKRTIGVVELAERSQQNDYWQRRFCALVAAEIWDDLRKPLLDAMWSIPGPRHVDAIPITVAEVEARRRILALIPYLADRQPTNFDSGCIVFGEDAGDWRIVAQREGLSIPGGQPLGDEIAGRLGTLLRLRVAGSNRTGGGQYRPKGRTDEPTMQEVEGARKLCGQAPKASKKRIMEYCGVGSTKASKLMAMMRCEGLLQTKARKPKTRT